MAGSATALRRLARGRRGMVAIDLSTAFVLTVLGARQRSGALGQSTLWFDDAWVAAAARMPLADSFHIGLMSPGFSALQRLVYLVFGDRTSAYQLIPFAFGSVAGGAVFLVLRERRVPWVGGVVAGVSLAYSPQLIAVSVLVKQYTIDCVGVVVLLWLTWRLIEGDRSDRRNWRWLVATAIVLMWVSATTVLAVMVCLAVAGIATLRQVGLRDAISQLSRLAGLTGLSVTALYVLVVRARSSDSLTGYWHNAYVDPRAPASDSRSWLRGTGNLLVEWLPFPVPIGFAILAVALFALLVVRPWRFLTVGGLLVLAPALSVLEILPYGGGRVDAHLIGVLAVALGAGLESANTLMDNSSPANTSFLPRAVVAFVAVGLIWSVIATANFTPVYPQEDVRPLVEYVEEHRTPDDVVLVYTSARFAYALYSDVEVDAIENDRGPSYYVEFDDPSILVHVGSRTDADANRPVVAEAAEMSDRVWLIGQHVSSRDFPIIVDELTAQGLEPIEDGTLASSGHENPGAYLQLWVRGDGDDVE